MSNFTNAWACRAESVRKRGSPGCIRIGLSPRDRSSHSGKPRAFWTRMPRIFCECDRAPERRLLRELASGELWGCGDKHSRATAPIQCRWPDATRDECPRLDSPRSRDSRKSGCSGSSVLPGRCRQHCGWRTTLMHQSRCGLANFTSSLAFRCLPLDASTRLRG
jgi:hypothetical protein